MCRRNLFISAVMIDLEFMQGPVNRCLRRVGVGSLLIFRTAASNLAVDTKAEPSRETINIVLRLKLAIGAAAFVTSTSQWKDKNPESYEGTRGCY